MTINLHFAFPAPWLETPPDALPAFAYLSPHKLASFAQIAHAKFKLPLTVGANLHPRYSQMWQDSLT